MTRTQDAFSSLADGSGCFRPLLSKGYIPVPIIPFNQQLHTRDGKTRPGGKTPGEFEMSTNLWRGYQGWQSLLTNKPSLKQISRWESWSIGGRPNAGILTGNIVAVDIDILEPTLADRAHSLAFSMLGATPLIRYGEAPKRLLLYRLENNLVMGKLKSTLWQSPNKENYAIEVLGKGQQFVAFGTHPKTQKPYVWQNTSPLDVDVANIPLTNRAALVGFLTAFDMMMEMEGYLGARKQLDPTETPTKASHELVDGMGHVSSAILSLPASLADDYHEWIRLGHAIKAAVPDPAIALELWHEFSAKSEVYDPLIADEKWRDFKPTSIGAGSIYHIAAEHGWQPNEAIIKEGDFDAASMPCGTILSNETGLPHEEWLTDYEGSSLPPRQWLLGKQLLRGQVTELVAPGGVGKSTLALSWAAAIAANRDLTHATPYVQGKVWVINNEDDLTELKRRFSAVRSYFDIPWEAIRGRVMVTGSGDPKWKVAAKNEKHQLQPTPFVAAAIARIKAENIVALIVDPLVSTHDADENSNSEMETVIGLFRQIAVQANCAVCVIHHTSKPPGGSSEGFAGNANAGRGASAVVYAARIALTLFEMSAQDANRYGIKEEQRHRYVRLDDAKANLSLKGSMSTWFYRATVDLGNGDEVGVLKPEKLKEREQADADELVAALLEMPSLISTGKVSLREAAKHAQAALAIDPEITLQAAMARIKKILKFPAPLLQNCNLFVWYDTEIANPGKGVSANFVYYGERER